MARRRNSDPTPAKPRTCGGCDDGWIPRMEQVTFWRKSGKKHVTVLERTYPLPADFEEDGKSVKYYSAVKRCGCVEPVEIREEKLVPMPAPVHRGMRQIGLNEFLDG